MYTIKAFVDGKYYTLHNPKVKELTSGDPYFETGDNLNGQAEFKIFPGHPYYDKVKKLVTDVIFYRDGKEEFYGRVLYDDEEFNGSKKVFVEGELAFFCDSIQRPKVYHNYSVRAYLQDIIDIHNSQVEERKQFVLGQVTVTDPNDSLYRYSNWEDTRTILKEKLTSRLGGHLVVRHENGLRILDYLSDETYYRKNPQKIEFGKNLLDFSKNMDASDLVTCVIPLGAKLEEEDQDESLEQIKEQRLTIAGVNGGVDYVTDEKAVAEYGKIYRTVIFDDVTVPANLKKKGEEYLKTVQFEKMVLELKAIDLNFVNEGNQELLVGDKIRCISAPNGMDKEFPLTKKRIYITQFKKNTITLGDESSYKSYTSSNRQETAQMEEEIKNIPSKSEILEQALKDAQDIINQQVRSGYAVHVPEEFIVADSTEYKTQAKNLWRWGLGGLAHYSQGYDGPIDGVALTMDGKINGDMILANSILAQSIDVGYRKEVQNAISNAESSANKYADNKQKLMKEQIDTLISNAENKIVLSASSLKEYASRKNYVVNGEQENLSIDCFNVSGTDYASVFVAEYLHMKCIKIAWETSGTVTLIQNLGNLESGDYTNVCDVAHESGKRPSYVQIGFSGNTSTFYLDSFSSDEFHVVKKTVKITPASKSIEISSYGTAGTVLYITNIRCLRDIQEVIDSTKASLITEINKITAEVTSKFENYNTKQETSTLIQAAVNDITIEVSKKYTTIGKVEEIAGNIVSGSEEDIRDDFDNKLSEYCTMVDANALIKAEADKIMMSVTESVSYNYCTNGDFTKGSDGLEGWIASNFCYVDTYNELNCLRIGTISWYSFSANVDKIYILFRAAREKMFSPDIVGLVVRVNDKEIGTVQPADLTEEWGQYKFEADIDTSSVKLSFQIRNANGAEAVYYGYLTDVRIFGNDSKETKAKLKVLSDQIETEVKRAMSIEESLSSKITQTESAINSEVSKKVGKTEIISSINQTAEKVTISASKINFNGLVTANSYFKILTNGSMEAISGKIGGWSIGSNYLKSSDGSITLESNGRIKYSQSYIESNGRGIRIKYGLELCTKSGGDFTDGTDLFRIVGLGAIAGKTLVTNTQGYVGTQISSSKRYKDHVRMLSKKEASTLLNVPVVWFRYKDGYLKRDDALYGKEVPGFYAEDIANALEPFAYFNEDGSVEDWNYRTLIPAMLKLIQEMYKEIGEKQ